VTNTYSSSDVRTILYPSDASKTKSPPKRFGFDTFDTSMAINPRI